MALIKHLLSKITDALPTEAELEAQVVEGMAWWDNFLTNTDK